jgi:hypothetical protein
MLMPKVSTFKQSRRRRLGVESAIRRSSKVCLFKISSLVEWISMLWTSLLQTNIKLTMKLLENIKYQLWKQATTCCFSGSKELTTR